MNAKLSEQTDTISEQADEIARLKALLMAKETSLNANTSLLFDRQPHL